jgi:hypothetical protein
MTDLQVYNITVIITAYHARHFPASHGSSCSHCNLFLRSATPFSRASATATRLSLVSAGVVQWQRKDVQLLRVHDLATIGVRWYFKRIPKKPFGSEAFKT